MRIIACVAAYCLVFIPCAGAQAPAAWVTIKGQVVFPEGAPLPKRNPLMVGGPDAAACLKNGPILDESLIVNTKTHGVKNVVVWLRPNNMDPKAALAAHEIHPNDAKRK